MFHLSILPLDVVRAALVGTLERLATAGIGQHGGSLITEGYRPRKSPEPFMRVKAQEHDAATGARGRGRAIVVTHRTGRGGLRELAVVVAPPPLANPDRASAEGAQRAQRRVASSAESTPACS